MPVIIDQIEFLKIFALGLLFGFLLRSLFIKKANFFEIERIIKIKELNVDNKSKKR
jgi:hypothetical protein